ncbi:hypothetical protein NDU88_008870 [Pleurodeles waltl]|uniref:Uncharacterized protein n=1 Tax=Pleurodeles waltl TaxID=8319 RepID=A0AAV7QT77_PLEWA|nr:hypothetical protein NDU88_008870 [Pleurodeles waltl]
MGSRRITRFYIGLRLVPSGQDHQGCRTSPIPQDPEPLDRSSLTQARSLHSSPLPGGSHSSPGVPFRSHLPCRGLCRSHSADRTGPGVPPWGPCIPQRPACVSRTICPDQRPQACAICTAAPTIDSARGVFSIGAAHLFLPAQSTRKHARSARLSRRAGQFEESSPYCGALLTPGPAGSAIHIRYLRAGARRRFGPRGAPYVGRYRAASSAHGGSAPGCSTGSSQPFTAPLFGGGRVKGQRLGSSFIRAPQSRPPCWILAGWVAASARG